MIDLTCLSPRNHLVKRIMVLEAGEPRGARKLDGILMPSRVELDQNNSGKTSLMEAFTFPRSGVIRYRSISSNCQAGLYFSTSVTNPSKLFKL